MAEDPVVQISDGTLRGKEVISSTGKTIFTFLGVPYASPPIGELRFKAPQPLQPWDGIRDAFKEGPIPAQSNFLTGFFGSEDCLYLNVYTPELPKSKDAVSKPVMFYMHGGGFILGSGGGFIYGPDYILDEDVILVTTNYRLGVLGYFNTGDEASSANCGLRDQLEALKWVNKNISAFGGDPKNITIFGESAGAASVQFMLVSPLSEGLFQKAITQSGSGLCPWALISTPRERAFSFGEKLGLKTTDSQELVKYLQSLPVDTVVNANVEGDGLNSLGFGDFLPSIEDHSNKDAYLPGNPIDLLKQGNFHNVPQIMGRCSSEGILFLYKQFVNKNFLEDMDKDVSTLLPFTLDLQYKLSPEEKQEFGQKIKNFYFGDKPVSQETKQEYVNMTSDCNFNYPIVEATKIICNLSKAPIYSYEFDFIGDLGIVRYLFRSVSKGVTGASHGDDIGYLFHIKFLSDIDPEEKEIEERKKMVKLWTNFTKYGNPTPEGNSPIDIEWLPFIPDNQRYLLISSEAKILKNFQPTRIAFWNDFYSSH